MENNEFQSNELGDWLAAERCRQNLSRAKLCEKQDTVVKHSTI